MSLSQNNTCSMFSFINNLLQEKLLETFKARFYIFSGLIKNSERQKEYVDCVRRSEQAMSKSLHKIVNLFEVNEPCFFQLTAIGSGSSG